MITLRCTRKAAKALEASPQPDPPATTSSLGDWYVNLIPTVAGGFFLFTSDRSLLSVVVPRDGPASEIIHLFVLRVANILSMIGLPDARIEEELEHFRDIRVAKTASRKVLGVMNEFAFHVQIALEDATMENKLSFSDFELRMAEMIQATLEWKSSGEAALELLQPKSEEPHLALSFRKRSMH